MPESKKPNKNALVPRNKASETPEQRRARRDADPAYPRGSYVELSVFKPIDSCRAGIVLSKCFKLYADTVIDMLDNLERKGPMHLIYIRVPSVEIAESKSMQANGVAKRMDVGLQFSPTKA